MEVELAPHTVFAGEVITTADGCLTNTSAEQSISTWLLMDDVITDGKVDVEIAGELLPEGGENDPATIWVHFFATLDGRQVAESVALDIRHALLGLYRPRIATDTDDVDEDDLAAVGEQALTADPTRAYPLWAIVGLDLFGPSSVQATLGTETVTVSGNTLGGPAGTQILLRFQNATICRFVLD
jgi:hypothetical protein